MKRSDIHRLTEVYAARGYDTDAAYSDVDPVYLQRVQRVERLILRSLRRGGLHADLASLKVLDYGCGNGRWLARWLSWGARPENLVGVDVRQDAIALARKSLPGIELRVSDGGPVSLDSERFDVVYQNLVFSSILDAEAREETARDMTSLARPGGLILWYDFTVDNPRNHDVRGIPAKDVTDLFRGHKVLLRKRVTLAPPIARKIATRTLCGSDAIECVSPFLRTHLFVAFSKM